MTVLPIRHFPEDKILRQKAKRVTRIDESIQRLIDNMVETLQVANGVGLAAPQVGIPLRLVVIQIPEEEPIILINPEITEHEGEQIVTEGCLSVPGYVGEIKRSAKVTVKGKDRHGKLCKIKGEELLAEVIEHECDHLIGKLYIDYLDSPDKLRKIEPRTEADEDEDDSAPDNLE